MRKGFGGSLIGNVLTLAGFIVGFMIVPGQNIWFGIIGALAGFAVSYIIRRNTLPKSERIRALAEKAAARIKEGADAVQFSPDGIRIIWNGTQQPVSMAALGGAPLRDAQETNAFIDVTCGLLEGEFYRVKGVYPPELRKGARETT